MRSRAEQGVAEWTFRHGRTLTRPTFTCAHCNGVTIIPLRARAEDCGGFCRLCHAPICSKCAGHACTPFERQMEREEASGRLMAFMGL